MLDDLKMIHERDAQDALGIVGKQGEQLSHNFEVPAVDASGVTNIVYAGMGGSALAALVTTVWPGYKMPFEVVRQYNIPAYVSDRTLFIAASYSGNTEETLSALEQAEAKNATIVVIAGGGKLADIARDKGYPCLILPKAEEPRYAVFYNLKAILDILDSAGLQSLQDTREQLEDVQTDLNELSAAWHADVPTAQNYAKQIALELMGKSIVVYSGPLMFPAAYKWKISCNENAKQIAWVEQYPEFNHNEFMGWTKQPTDKPYAIVDLRSSLEHQRLQKRFVVSERLLSGLRPSPIVVEVLGDTVLKQLLWTSVLGDFVTIYLALLNGVNPAPVELIERFKKEMNA